MGPELQDDMVKKIIASDIYPAEVAGLMKKSNKIYSQILNSRND
jgi:hypothetical protein